MARPDEYDDDRLVIVERGGNTGLGMMLLGLAIGAGAALLLAPASGEETRERLQRDAQRASRKVRDFTDSIGDTVTDGIERTRSSFDARVDRAREAVGARKRAVTDAMEAGRGAVDDTRADLERAVADAKRAYADSRRAYREARFSYARRVASRHQLDGNGQGLPDRAEESHAADHDVADGTAEQG